jgi:hypothetical protein
MLSIVPAYYFGHDEISRHFINETISKSPAIASARFDSVEKSGFKKFISFQVRYRFLVNNTEYSVLTTPTDERGALKYRSETDTQVVYYANDPSVNILKKYYDLRHTTGTLGQSVVIVGVISTLIALPIALFFSWLFGWFKRKKPVTNVQSA